MVKIERAFEMAKKDEEKTALAFEVVPNLSYAAYDASPGLRAGYLAALDRGTPGKAELTRSQPKDTAALRWGSALHTMILEPARFANEYTIGGPVNKKTGKPYGSDTVAFAEWAMGQVKPILTHEEFRLITGMADAIAAHPVARTIRDEPRQTELSVFWQLDGTPCKARLDCLQPETIWDIKSCHDASYRGFERAIANFAYHMQAAWYLDGAGQAGLVKSGCRYLWIAVENAAPYALAVYQASLELLQVGHDRCEQAVALWRDCEKKKVWPAAYAQEVITMAAPRWMLPQDEALEA
jgi:exodeoxyribonuclease VIII